MSSVKAHPCPICKSITRNRIACSRECSSKIKAKEPFKCLACKKEFKSKDRIRKFCSSSCANGYNNIGKVHNVNGVGGFIDGHARNHGNNKNGLKPARTPKFKACKQCNQPHKNKVFCSPKCQQKWATEHKAFYEKNCELCGKHFSGGSILKDVRFCSNPCARRYTGNVLREKSRENGKSSYLDSVRICPVCKEQIPNTRYKRANQRCSVKCDGIYKTSLVVEAWKLNPDDGTAKQGGLARSIRTYLIKKADGKCTRCSRSDIHTVTGNYVLEVDHVDGNRFNNNPDNLEVLCSNCHSLTPTFKGGNVRAITVVVSCVAKPNVSALASKSNVASWLADDTIHNGKSVLPKHVRDYLLAEAGYRCTVSSCGWGEVNQFTGRVPLEVDHVDGDAHNNSKDNLRVVCPQCHALSPFHRALNRKSSRVDRGRSSK